MLEVALDPLGLPLDAAEVSGGGLDELQLGPRRSQFRDRLLEVGVGHLVGVELGAVTGQVEDLDLVLVLDQPVLHGLAVMHSQVVQDQVDLAARVLDEPAQEVDQNVRVQSPVEGLPPHLALVGDGGDDRQAVALVVHPDHRRLALGCVAAAAHVVAAQAGLVAPVDLGALDLGARGDDRVFLVEPLLDRRRRLLVGLLHGLLRREAPALEIQTHRAHGQLDAVAVPDELGDGLARPQRVDHLQLVGRAVADQSLNLALLLGVEGAAAAHRSAAAVDVDRLPTAGLKGLHRRDHRRARHLALRRRVLQTRAVQPHLHRTSAALVERIHRQRSGVDLFHARSDSTTCNKFKCLVPDQ